jgi:hypothetical protein
MADGQLDLGLLTAFSAQPVDNLNRFLDDAAANAPPELRDILFESRQSTMGRAILADVIDVIPLGGDISNFFPVRHAGRIDIDRRRRVSCQALDLLLGRCLSQWALGTEVVSPQKSGN